MQANAYANGKLVHNKDSGQTSDGGAQGSCFPAGTLIDMADGKLFYDMKNKQILTKYFHPAKSYPEGNKNIKYYYYDSECNIKYEDIMDIKSIVIDNFCQK